MTRRGRIELTRIIAINWYGFRQIIDVRGHVLLTGETGTGKSALLDLIQYVLLGEDARFNKAAAGKGHSRTLVSYCLCDTNTSRNDEPHYTRRSGVTLIALEFTRPGNGEPSRETWGIRIAFESPTSRPSTRYFMAPQRVEWSDCLDDAGAMLSEERFCTRIKRDLNGEYWEKQGSYLDEMALPKHLHFDRLQLDRTMPKAVAFEPEENFEKFIRDFILEEGAINMEEVRMSVGEHRRMQARLEELKSQHRFLADICRLHGQFEAEQREQKVYRWMREALREAQAMEHMERTVRAHANKMRETEDDRRAIEEKMTQQRTMQETLDDVRGKAHADPKHDELSKLVKQRRELHFEVQRLESSTKSFREQLDDRGRRWEEWLERGRRLPIEGLAEALFVKPELLDALRRGTDVERHAALPHLADRFGELWKETEQRLAPLNRELAKIDERLRELARDREALDDRQTPGDFPLLHALRRRLPDSRPPRQLCRLIEVKPNEERWWTALELFLRNNRWVIVVHDDDYGAALEVMRATPPGAKPESVMNPSEARMLRGRVDSKSLASKVEVRDPIAEAFVNHLLGDVICVETEEDLERCEAGRAITPKGTFKQAPLRRRLRPAEQVPYTLGEEGLKRMRVQSDEERKEKMTLRKVLDERRGDAHAWLDSGKRIGLDDRSIPDAGAAFAQLPERQEKLAALTASIGLLSTPEREARIDQLHGLERDFQNLTRSIGALEERLRQSDPEIARLDDALRHAREDHEQAKRDAEAMRNGIGTGFLNAELEQRLHAMLAEFSKWVERHKEAEKREGDARKQADQIESARNEQRRLLARAHAECDTRLGDPSDAENTPWQARFDLLDGHELQRYTQLAEEKKREWEDRLKDHVLDQLNEQLRKARSCIERLRRDLDCPIGGFRYEITARRDPAYASFWQLLSSGFEPTDPLLASARDSELDLAKQQLGDAIEAAGQPGADPAVLRRLDYRCYHRYKLEMIPLGVPQAAAIDLNRSAKNMSGGENQVPFFVSMLAAFHRVYDLGSRQYQENLGLVVMDEAFSKLSGDRIEDCLSLARNFQLQLIMAFPVDRLSTMLPFAHEIILCRKHEQRGDDGYVSRVDNIPTVMTPAQVRDALR